MRKEILLAIIAGGGFGLVIAFGVWKVTAKIRLLPKLQVHNRYQRQFRHQPTS